MKDEKNGTTVGMIIVTPPLDLRLKEALIRLAETSSRGEK
jgi:hypothetical protein